MFDNFLLGLVRLCLNEFDLQAPRKQTKLDAIAETCMQIIGGLAALT